MIKRFLILILALIMVLGLAACGAGGSQGNETATETTGQAGESAEAADGESAESGETAEGEGGKTLVVYFSVTGNTEGIAKKIAAATGGDLYRIQPAQEYTDADLNYNDNTTRATVEQKDPSTRPEIGSEPVSLEGYTTIYIGYPIWWGQEPRIMDTFVESYDFTGITLIPFCTSGSSGIGQSGSNLEANAGTGTWLEGKRFAAGALDAEIEDWIAGLH